MSYDPDAFLETTVRSLKAYLESVLDSEVLVGGAPVGLWDETAKTGIYEVVMDFDAADEKARLAPIPNVLIHLSPDDFDPRVLGIGLNEFGSNYDAAAHTASPDVADMHMINFDVGVWTSDRSGGTTARMRAVQALYRAFHGSLGIRNCRSFTDQGDGGVEIVRFQGGRFITETVNDVPLFRMVGGELEVRVFSRTRAATVPTIESIDQNPGFTVAP